MKTCFISFFTFMALVFGLSGSANASETRSVRAKSSPTVCVLDFERVIHPISKAMFGIFAGDADATLIQEAVPTDLEKCLLGNYHEIILVAHALEDPGANDQVSLGYFTRFTSEEEGAAIKDGKITQAELNSHVNIPFYHLKAFLPQIFRTIHQEMQAMRAAGHPISVKRIRWMSCLPSQVFAVYPEFGEIVSEFGIGLDIAPKQILFSVIEGQTVTGFDKLWLAESAQPETAPAGHPDAWFYSYVNLDTVLLDQFGSATSLHGKYKIDYQGMALGLSSRWTEVYLRYADVAGMKVGEKRAIRGLHLDFSLGFGEDFELDVLPKPTFEIPSDLNSAGVSLGLFEDITIERLY